MALIAETPIPKKRNWALIFFLLFFVLPVAGFSLYTWATLNFVYSQGERAGYIQKFSQKGWVFKTWDGELAMVTLPGQIPEKFYFSVRDQGVAKQLEQNIGQRVMLKYNQHRGIPTTWFGDTQYFVTNVQTIEAALSLPAGN